MLVGGMRLEALGLRQLAASFQAVLAVLMWRLVGEAGTGGGGLAAAVAAASASCAPCRCCFSWTPVSQLQQEGSGTGILLDLCAQPRRDACRCHQYVCNK